MAASPARWLARHQHLLRGHKDQGWHRLSAAITHAVVVVGELVAGAHGQLGRRLRSEGKEDTGIEANCESLSLPSCADMALHLVTGPRDGLQTRGFPWCSGMDL